MRQMSWSFRNCKGFSDVDESRGEGFIRGEWLGRGLRRRSVAFI